MKISDLNYWEYVSEAFEIKEGLASLQA